MCAIMQVLLTSWGPWVISALLANNYSPQKAACYTCQWSVGPAMKGSTWESPIKPQREEKSGFLNSFSFLWAWCQLWSDLLSPAIFKNSFIPPTCTVSFFTTSAEQLYIIKCCWSSSFARRQDALHVDQNIKLLWLSLGQRRQAKVGCPGLAMGHFKWTERSNLGGLFRVQSAASETADQKSWTV